MHGRNLHYIASLREAVKSLRDGLTDSREINPQDYYGREHIE
jgi:hypothetical protein